MELNCVSYSAVVIDSFKICGIMIFWLKFNCRYFSLPLNSKLNRSNYFKTYSRLCLHFVTMRYFSTQLLIVNGTGGTRKETLSSVCTVNAQMNIAIAQTDEDLIFFVYTFLGVKTVIIQKKRMDQLYRCLCWPVFSLPAYDLKYSFTLSFYLFIYFLFIYLFMFCYFFL